MCAVEELVDRLDRGQRKQLRDEFHALHLMASGDRPMSAVFAALMELVDVADAVEAYVGLHLDREMGERQ